MKKKIIIICCSIILIIVISLFIFINYQSHLAVQKVEKKSEVGTASTSTSGLTTASSTILQHPTLAEINAVKIDESDWQTYKNKQYGFEISAPKDWTIKLTASNGTLMSTLGSLQIYSTNDNNIQSEIPIDLSVEEDDKNLSIEDYYSGTGVKSENLIKINIPTSDEAVAVRSQDSPVTYSYLVKKGKLIYEFDPMEWGSDILHGDAMMKAIVETFRFTK
jgi:hypothetical protein